MKCDLSTRKHIWISGVIRYYNATFKRKLFKEIATELENHEKNLKKIY